MYTKEEHLLTLFGRMEAVDRLVFEQLHRLLYSPLYLYTYSLFDIQQDDSLDQKEPTLYYGKVELVNKKDPTQILSILPFRTVSWRADIS